MAVPKTNISASRPALPPSASKPAPKNDPKRPQDNTAATQAPKETRSAVNNGFGKLPANVARNTATNTQGNDASKGTAAQPKNGAKTPIDNRGLPKTGNLMTENPASSNTADDTQAPSAVDPKVQAILDTRLPDGKSVKEKLDGDAPAYIIKAAQDHYNKQKEAGEQPDAVSRFYLNNAARDMAKNGVKEERVSPEKLAEVFNTEQIDKNLDEIAKDPVFLKWASEQQANSVQNTIDKNPDIARLVAPYLQEGENHVNALRRMQSDTMSSQEFADAVANGGKDLVIEGMKMLSSLGLGEKEMLGVGNTLAENIRGKYTPDAPKPVVDPNTNKPIQTEDGNNLAILPDGTNIALDMNGKAVADKQGNAYVYYQDGSYKLDANGKFIQYDAKAKSTFANYDGTKYMLGPDRKGRYDAQGRPLAIDSGAPVALGKDGKAATDPAGNKLVFDPETGKAVTDPASGNAVVIDPATQAIVQTDIGGKVIAGQNGDPYAVDQKTGKFVQDAQGRYVRINKENSMPGVVPGYVVDDAQTKVMVDPYNAGRPIVPPALGKTVIFAPGTNSPELVPLDRNGAPRLASDGKNIVYDVAGNTVVRHAGGKGPDWMVDGSGSYVTDANGNYIATGERTGMASPVDAKEKPVQNANGQVPLWDPKSNAPMLTKDGENQIVLAKDGNLLQTNAQGQTVIEEKTGLPYLVDPATRASKINPETGRSILLDKSGAEVEYNADDGYKYLINPKTKTTVKTADGYPVVMNDTAGVPYAVKPDGMPVTNPDTGNTVVYNPDGQPAAEKSTGLKVEIVNGKASLIEPATKAPIGTYDGKTGGYKPYNPDGSVQVNPDTGNEVEVNPRTGVRVEVDAATGQIAEDGFGNKIVLGPDNTRLKTPDGNNVVMDKDSGLPVAVDAGGKVQVEPASGLPRVIDSKTGAPLEDPVTKAPVVADKASGAPIQIDNDTGQPVKDPVTGLSINANVKTGEQAKASNGAPIGVIPDLNAPVYFDKEINAFTVADPDTGKTITNPATGARRIVDPQYGIVVDLMQDKDGNLTLVDDEGKPRKDELGYILYFSARTGQIVIKLQGGKEVDARTLEEPEAIELQRFSQNPSVERPASPAASANGPDLPPPMDQPWAQPGYRMSPEERAEFIRTFDPGLFSPSYEQEAEIIEKRKNLPGNEKLKNIPTPDLVAVRTYTRLGYRDINAALETGDPERMAKWESRIKGILSGLNQMEEAGFVYEGPALRFQESTRQYAPPFQETGYFRNKQIMSVSIDPEWEWKGDIKIKFDKAIGVDISSVAYVPAEQEVIIQPNKVIHNESIDDWVDMDDASRDKYGSGKFVTANVHEPSAQTAPSSSASSIDIIPPGSSTEQLPLVAESTDAPASRWGKLVKAAAGYASDALDVIGGGAQVVLGALQVAAGVKSNDPYDITSGTLDVTSGALAIGSFAAGIIGGAAAAAALPLAVASVGVGLIAGIVDFAGSLDDDEKFADRLEQEFGKLGILRENWRPKAQEAYKDSSEKYIQPNYQA